MEYRIMIFLNFRRNSVKKIAVIIFSLSTMQVINAGENPNFFTQAQRKTMQCCRLGAAVPPCLECMEKRKNGATQPQQNQEKKRAPSLSESQELRRCP